MSLKQASVKIKVEKVGSNTFQTYVLTYYHEGLSS